MLDLFQIIGAAVGALAIVAGGVWAITRFFLFGQLARLMEADIRRSVFADASESVLLVETTIKNHSKTRTEVRDVSYRPLFSSHLSPEDHAMSRRTTSWQPILIDEPGQNWNPGETAQAVLEIPWPKDRVAVPVQFRFRYVESIDARGVWNVIRQIITGGPLREQETVYDILLVTRPKERPTMKVEVTAS